MGENLMYVQLIHVDMGAKIVSWRKLFLFQQLGTPLDSNGIGKGKMDDIKVKSS
jgi:hypothetical protein